MASQPDDLLRRPLYVFDLPREILATLEPAIVSAPAPTDGQHGNPQQLPRAVSSSQESPLSSKSTSCAMCCLSFADVQEQRSHVRSDMHAYNLKQKMRGLKIVSDAEFEKMVGDLDESLSGSESSESDSDSEIESGPKPKKTGDMLSSLLERQGNVSEPLSENFVVSRRKRGAGKPPLVWLTSSALPSNTSLGIWRAIFTNAEQHDDTGYMDALQKKQLAPRGPLKNPVDGGVALPKADTGPHYFMCMIGGGHFAAMVVSLAPKVGKKSGIEERQASVIAHKTFHRYTTRRKQGGAQSANDSAKGNAHSAGSSIRRYNEAALVDEVRLLLSEWGGMIESSELLFIRATGSTNRRTLFGPYDGQVLRQDDPRNRGFPFSTRRATQGELMRCFVELTRVKVGQLDQLKKSADEAKEADAKAVADAEEARAKQSTSKVATAPKRSPEEEQALQHTAQIETLIRRNKAPALVSYLTSNNLPTSFRLQPPDTAAHHHAPTPLHLAATGTAPAIVTSLLIKLRADPTVKNDEGRTAFELSGDRATRDAFKIARSEMGEGAWDWDNGARVPDALAREEAEARAESEKREEEVKEAARRKEGMERLRAEEQKKKEERRMRGDEQREKKMGKGKTIGTSNKKTAEQTRQEQARGMSPEMQARLEREKRARAAEERMRRMQSASGGAG